MRPLLLAALLLCASPAADSTYTACIDHTSSNAEWSECGAAYLARADRALNAAWRHTFELAKGKTKLDLLAEQRAWIAYKETACKFYANGDWGREGKVLHFFGCRGDLIEKRTAELVDFGKFIAQ